MYVNKPNVIKGAGGMYGRGEVHTGIWRGNLRERDLDELSTDYRIM
jgi:hypothetical protein